jgi:hypothetical protein
MFATTAIAHPESVKGFAVIREPDGLSSRTAVVLQVSSPVELPGAVGVRC